MNEGYWLLLMMMTGVAIMFGSNFLPQPYSPLGLLLGIVLFVIGAFVLVGTDLGGGWL